VALITVLLVVSLATIAAVAMASRQQLDIRRAENLLDADQADLYAQGAEQWAEQLLARDAKRSQVDTLGEDWAKTLPAIPVEGGAIAAAIGLNVTAYMSLIEVYWLHHLLPYDLKVARPLAVTIVGSALFAFAVNEAGGLGSVAKFSVAVAGLLLLYYVVLTMGLNADDRNAIDPKGNLRRLRFMPRKPTLQG